MKKYFLLILLFINAQLLLSEIKITYPNRNDTILCNRITRIQWEGQGNAEVALFYSTDDGKNWILIEDSLKTSYYDWKVPILDTLNIQFRVITNLFIPAFLLYEIPNAHEFEIRSASISKDGKYILSSSKDSKVKIWDIKSQLCIDSLIFSNKDYVYSSKFISEDSILIATSDCLILWERKSKRTTKYGGGLFSDLIRECAIHPNKRIVAGCSYDGTIKIFDLNLSTNPIQEIIDPDGLEIYTCSFSPDGKSIGFAGSSGIIYIWDWQLDTMQISFKGHGNNGSNMTIWTCDFSPNKMLIASGGVDNTVKIWHLLSQQMKFNITAHTFHVRATKFYPNGSLLLSSGLDGMLYQWDPYSGLQRGNELNHNGQVLDANYSLTGDTIVSCGRNNAIRLWRNFIELPDIDTSICVVKYPITVKIPHLYSTPGNKIGVPILLYIDSLIPKPQSLQIVSQAKIEIPAKLLDIISNVNHSLKINNKDTISFNINTFWSRDTLSLLDALVLSSDMNFDVIHILDFKLDELPKYKVEKINGSITVESACEGDTKRILAFGDLNFQMTITPNPTSDYYKVNIQMLEDGYYKFDLLDNKGSLVKELINQNFKNGNYSLTFQTNNIANGVYFLRIITPTYQKFVKKIIINK